MPQILSLERHDFLEMRLLPRAGLGILEHAAPHRVDQGNGCVQRLPRALDGRCIAGFRAGDGEVHAVGVDIFLHLAPAADLVLIGLVVGLRERVALRLGQEGGSGRLDLKGLADRGAGRGIVDDRLQQRLHARRFDIAPDLDDLGAVRTEHDGRGPAPVAIAAGEIGIGVLIGPHRQVFFCEQRLHVGIGVGRLLHHVAPVAPHRLEIEDDEALLGGCAREQLVVPLAPFQVGRE